MGRKAWRACPDGRWPFRLALPPFTHVVPLPCFSSSQVSVDWGGDPPVLIRRTKPYAPGRPPDVSVSASRFLWAGWLAGWRCPRAKEGRAWRQELYRSSVDTQPKCMYMHILGHLLGADNPYEDTTCTRLTALLPCGQTSQSRSRWRDSGRAKTGKSQRAREGKWEHDGHTIRNQSTGARVLALLDEEEEKKRLLTGLTHARPPRRCLLFLQAIPVAVKNTGF